MNAPEPRDPGLSQVLQAWRVEKPDDPALAGKVWQRISSTSSRASPFALWTEGVASFLTRPAVAIAACALFAVLGALAAQAQIHARHDARVSRLAAEYARTIDPILMTDAGHAHSP